MSRGVSGLRTMARWFLGAIALVVYSTQRYRLGRTGPDPNLSDEGILPGSQEQRALTPTLPRMN
jgi:hypothetical protein